MLVSPLNNAMKMLSCQDNFTRSLAGKLSLSSQSMLPAFKPSHHRTASGSPGGDGAGNSDPGALYLSSVHDRIIVEK
jgi:hypothetical protein